VVLPIHVFETVDETERETETETAARFLPSETERAGLHNLALDPRDGVELLKAERTEVEDPRCSLSFHRALRTFFMRRRRRAPAPETVSAFRPGADSWHAGVGCLLRGGVMVGCLW
jgi:hypothetical protein